MVIDYSPQRQVSKNRPRKQPAAIFIMSMLVTAGIAFLLGIGTGWLIFAHGRKGGAASVEQKGAEPAASNQAPSSPQAAGKATEPSLTFYETLPKGGRELMGSGLNLPKQAEQPQAKAATKSKPAAAAKTQTAEEAQAQTREAKAQAKEPEKKAAGKDSAAKEGEGKGKFVVQVASYHVRKEAEEARDKLKENGIAAYVVEVNVPDKGTYYRVRVGRRLDQQAARELAEKAGKGSILIPE